MKTTKMQCKPLKFTDLSAQSFKNFVGSLGGKVTLTPEVDALIQLYAETKDSNEKANILKAFNQLGVEIEEKRVKKFPFGSEVQIVVGAPKVFGDISIGDLLRDMFKQVHTNAPNKHYMNKEVRKKEEEKAKEGEERKVNQIIAAIPGATEKTPLFSGKNPITLDVIYRAIEHSTPENGTLFLNMMAPSVREVLSNKIISNSGTQVNQSKAESDDKIASLKPRGHVKALQAAQDRDLKRFLDASEEEAAKIQKQKDDLQNYLEEGYALKNKGTTFAEKYAVVKQRKNQDSKVL